MNDDALSRLVAVSYTRVFPLASLTISTRSSRQSPRPAAVACPQSEEHKALPTRTTSLPPPVQETLTSTARILL